MSEEAKEGTVIVAESGNGRYAQDIEAGGHRIVAGEPAAAGGDDSGPSPYDLLLAALGSCTSITIRMYAERKEWPLERVTVTLGHRRVHAEDCADCEQKEGRVTEIERNIRLEGDLDEDQTVRLMQIADRCPVHQTLTGEIKVRSRLVG